MNIKSKGKNVVTYQNFDVNSLDSRICDEEIHSVLKHGLIRANTRLCSVKHLANFDANFGVRQLEAVGG